MTEIMLYKFLCTLLTILIIILITVLILMVIFEYILSKKSNDENIEEKRQEKLVEDFYEKLNEVSNQSTKEILESLIEMQDLDKLYSEITIDFMDEISYLKLKESTLNKIISDKIKTIEEGKNKKENYKALLDETKGCKERYPQYNEVFVENINIIKSKLDKKKK